MLKARVLFDSSVEDLLGWKCCNISGMNLEVQVKNEGDSPIVIKGAMTFSGEGGETTISNMYPYGGGRIEAGDSLAFYCSADEKEMSGADRLVLEDGNGVRYEAKITGAFEEAERL